MSTSHDEYYRGLEAAARVLAKQRGEPADSRAAAVHNAIDELLSPNPQAPPPACHDGCGHCCHFPVGITLGEAMRLAAAIDHSAAHKQHVLAEADATEGLPWRELIARPCPLLADNRCAFYKQRPVPCRALASSDDAACRDALTGDGTVPRDQRAYWRGMGVTGALANETPSGCRELRSALAAVLRQPGAPEVAFAKARQTTDAP